MAKRKRAADREHPPSPNPIYEARRKARFAEFFAKVSHEEILAEVSKTHFRPVAKSTLDRYKQALEDYVKFQATLIGDEEEARKLIQPDQPFPDLDTVKAFLLARSQSRFRATLSLSTLTKIKNDFLNGWERFVRSPVSLSSDDKAQLSSYLVKLSEGIITNSALDGEPSASK